MGRTSVDPGRPCKALGISQASTEPDGAVARSGVVAWSRSAVDQARVKALSGNLGVSDGDGDLHQYASILDVSNRFALSRGSTMPEAGKAMVRQDGGARKIPRARHNGSKNGVRDAHPSSGDIQVFTRLGVLVEQDSISAAEGAIERDPREQFPVSRRRS